MNLTSISAPSLAVATRFADHFTAFGVDEVVTSSPDTLTLKFDQQSGFEHAVASLGLKNAIDGVKLVLDLADGAAVPRMLPSARYLLPTLEQLPGVNKVVSTDSMPAKVVVFAANRSAGSDLSTLLNDRLPDGSTIGVTTANVAPWE